MNYLKVGGHNPEKLDLMLSVTRISSEQIIDAIRDRLLRGATIEAAAALNGIPASNLVRALDKLNEVARVIERIKEIDWASFKTVK
jgi:hypothetical protein